VSAGKVPADSNSKGADKGVKDLSRVDANSTGPRGGVQSEQSARDSGKGSLLGYRGISPALMFLLPLLCLVGLACLAYCYARARKS
jgi:hypothetical protein